MPRFQIRRKRVDPEDQQQDEVKTEDTDSVGKPDKEFNEAFDNFNMKSPEYSDSPRHPPKNYAEDTRSEPVDIPQRKMSRREYANNGNSVEYRPQYRNRDRDYYRPEPNLYKRGTQRPVDTIRSRGEAGKLQYASAYGRNNHSMQHSEKVKAVYSAAFGDV